MTRSSENALELDHTIDRILQAPAGRLDAAEEGELGATARLLRDALPRVHPRFSFEEHLAARLSAARRWGGGSLPAAQPTPIGPRLLPPRPAEAAQEDTADPAAVEHRRLGLVAGGAIASGVSIAGAAIVVWRRSRSGGLF